MYANSNYPIPSVMQVHIYTSESDRERDNFAEIEYIPTIPTCDIATHSYPSTS